MERFEHFEHAIFVLGFFLDPNNSNYDFYRGIRNENKKKSILLKHFCFLNFFHSIQGTMRFKWKYHK